MQKNEKMKTTSSSRIYKTLQYVIMALIIQCFLERSNDKV